MTSELSSNPLTFRGALLVGRHSPALREALWDLVTAAKQDDLMAPVTVVSPSRYASLSLRQDLGLVGFVNVRFIQLPVLAELLGGAALAAQGRKPLTSTLQGIALRQSLLRAKGSLEPVNTHPKTQASVRASFRELRRLDAAELEDLEQRGGVAGEVVSLYRKYRAEVSQQWFDREDLVASAAEAVALERAAALDDLGHIVFYLPHSVSPAEAKLMQALAGKGRCSVIAGNTGDFQADAPITALVEGLEPELGKANPAAGAPADPVLPPGDAHLHIAPTTHEELRWVIRQIVEEADSSGTPFHRMAVLYRMENPYATLIRDEMALAGIPLAGPGRDILAESAVGRTLLGLLALPGNDFRRDLVMAWLTGCPVSPPGGNLDTFSPSQWDAVSRQAGIVSGVQQWLDRLDIYEKATLERADRDEALESISEAQAEARRESARTAAEIRAFIQRLAKDMTPPDEGSSWTAFCAWVEVLLSNYLARPSEAGNSFAAEQFDRDLETIAGVLQDIKAADALKQSPEAADAIQTPTTAEDFRQVLTDALQAPQGHLGPTGQGVFVSPFETAAGMDFDRVWLVGMIEGGTPPAIRPDPLLPELPRRPDGLLSRAEQRIAAERFNYLSALSTAPRRSLSYPVSETSSRRQAHPSRWFLDQATELAGEAVHSSNLPSYSSSPWLSVARSAEESLANLLEVNLADILDYNLQALVGWKRDEKPPSRHPLAAQGALALGNRLRRSRNSRRLTHYDGNLSGVAATARFARGLDRTPISPTRLETWASCPFRYFLGSVLRLGALEKPEDTTSISALDRGSLIHGILEKFIADCTVDGRLPAPGQQWRDTDRTRLMQVAEEQFSAAESRGVTGRPLLWDIARQDILDDLSTFLVEDSALRSRVGTGLTRVEAEFGMGGDTPEVLDQETGLKFRGYIDRVDVTTDGSEVLVIDYKTGRASYYDGLEKDPIDRGKHLQLGVYSLAAKELVPGAARFRAAYWFPTSRGGFKFAPGDFLEIANPDVGQRFREGVNLITSGIRKGAFPANPGPFTNNKYENCRFCDFDTLCPSRREDVWERKKRDELAAGYLELVEGAGNDDPGVGEEE